MRVPPLAIAGLLAGLVAVASASAQDPFVYRECLSRCRQFKDRACCHETCSYTACIADKTRASAGHGSASGGVRLDQIDPGAWSAAMAACYPWITILQECSAGAVTPPAGGNVETRPSPDPSPQPVKGAFGPPRKSFGHLAPPFENHEQKIVGEMTATSYRFTLERKPKSEGAITITHTYKGTVPEILKPGDVIELSCESEASASGPYPPSIGGSCHWDVEGSVTIDPVSTKASFVGIASDGKLHASGGSTTRFKVGSGGTVLIRAAQGGYYWGSSDNWNPAEYVFTFVP